MVDAHPKVLVEIAGSVVPPAETIGLGSLRPVAVDQAPCKQLVESLTLLRRDMGAAVHRTRVPNVVVGWRDVHVATDHQRVCGRGCVAQPAREAVVPRELAGVEG